MTIHRDHKRADRTCIGRSQEHLDARALVEYLFERNGFSTASHLEIAGALNMWITYGGGVRKVDTARYNRARNHVRDRVTPIDLKPCCGYSLNYRKSGKGTSSLTLVDPSGGIGHHANAALESVTGWISRERQHHTENQRMVETLEMLGDHVLAYNDRVGYRLIQRGIVELEEHGTITPPTIAQMTSWAGALS